MISILYHIENRKSMLFHRLLIQKEEYKSTLKDLFFILHLCYYIICLFLQNARNSISLF